MKFYLLPVAVFAVLACVQPLSAQNVLSIDFAERGADPGSTTFPGFEPFSIGSVGSATIAQTNATSQTFGAITLTITGNGPNPVYDDRIRSNPVNSGDFTESLLLRDFFFSGSAAVGAGLNLNVQGLMPNQLYRVKIWSFDASSLGDRISDWFAHGTLVRDNYIFNRSVAPTNNTQYQFDFKAATTEAGSILIQGRRDAATTAGDPGVFINALQIEQIPNSEAEPPEIAVGPAPATVYAGDNAVLSVEPRKSPPYSYQWSLDGMEIAGATNRVQVLTNLQIASAGTYSVVVSNLGGVISGSTMVTVLPVTNITIALVSYWPLDAATSVTPDATPRSNDLTLVNMDATNLGDGQFDNALMFNGVDEYVAREHTNSIGLPIYDSPNYSVTLWVKGAGVGQNDRRVFAEASTNTTTPLFSIGTHSTGANGVVDIFLRNGDGVIPLNHRRSTLEAFDGQWHHIAWVDRSGFPSLYVDGVLDTNDFSYARGALILNTTALGAIHRAAPTAYFNGLIDDVAVWSRSLTTSEVQSVRDNQPRIPAPFITDIDVTSDMVVLTIRATDTAGLVVEETSDLSNINWTQVPGVVFGTPVGNTITASFARPNDSQRFYRVAR